MTHRMQIGILADGGSRGTPGVCASRVREFPRAAYPRHGGIFRIGAIAAITVLCRYAGAGTMGRKRKVIRLHRPLRMGEASTP